MATFLRNDKGTVLSVQDRNSIVSYLKAFRSRPEGSNATVLRAPWSPVLETVYASELRKIVSHPDVSLKPSGAELWDLFRSALPHNAQVTIVFLVPKDAKLYSPDAGLYRLKLEQPGGEAIPLGVTGRSGYIPGYPEELMITSLEALRAAEFKKAKEAADGEELDRSTSALIDLLENK